jgi:hypothetical protein
VSGNPDWPLHSGISVVLGLAAVAAAARRRPAEGGPLGFAVLCAASLGLASGLVWAFLVAARETYYPFETVRAWALWGLQLVLAAALVDAAWRQFAAPRPAEGPRHVAAALDDLRRPGRRLAGLGGLAHALMAGTAVLGTLLLIFDGRYRDFLVPDFLAPAAVIAGLALLRAGRDGIAGLGLSGLLAGERATAGTPPRSWAEAARAAPLAAALATLLPLAALGIVIAEGPVNREADAWALLLLLLAVPFVGDVLAWRGRRG